MRTSSDRSARRLSVSSDSGSVLQTPACFTSGFVSDTAGAYAPVSDDRVIAEALRILSRRLVRSNPLTSPRATREYLALRFGGLEHEVFACVFLDTRHRVIACEELFRGTLDGASVHPREVVKRTLLNNASAPIFAHNHPSGICEPSQADEMITARLRDAAALIDVRVLDHIVVSGGQFVSFAERGLL